MTFETIGKVLIVFERLILGKKVVDGVIEPRREIGIRYEFDFKIIWKGLKDSYSRFQLNFQEIIKFVIVSVRLILQKVGVDGLTGPQQEKDARCKFHFISP